MLFLREVDIFCELLGQRAAALGQRFGFQVGPERPDDGQRVHAVMALEAAVLYRDHGIDVGLRDGITGGEGGAGGDGLIQLRGRQVLLGGAVQPPALQPQHAPHGSQRRQQQHQQPTQQPFEKVSQCPHGIRPFRILNALILPDFTPIFKQIL